MRIASVCAVLLLAGLSAAQARCEVSRWNATWGIESVASMLTDGQPCSTSVDYTGGTSEIRSVSIVGKPANGRASASGRSVTYQPRRGFRGQDQFVFRLVGRNQTGPASATVRVYVRVP